MESPKKNRNVKGDNFSDFLNEINILSKEKTVWISDKLSTIDTLLEEIEKKSTNPFLEQISEVRIAIREPHVDTIKKAFQSIKLLNDVVDLKFEMLPKDKFILVTLKTILSLYIDIARFTSDEILAKQALLTGKSLHSQD